MLAYLFPGQGSQIVGMGKDLHDAEPVCRRTFEEADAALGIPLSRACFEGPAEALKLTATAQPAILAASVAALRLLVERGVRPDIVAGHSLGEYSALVASGALGFADALRLVRARGQYMQEAVPVGVGAMAAVIGLDREAIEAVCAEAANGRVVSPANMNGPGQTVISGHADAVERAMALARQRGAMKAIPLEVTAPFHCALMQPAADRLEKDLKATSFNDLTVPLVANVTAKSVRSGDAARDLLIRQVTAPVRWEDSVKALAELGVVKALEVGPGKVLTGLVKRIDRRIDCTPAGTLEAITAAGVGA